MKKAKSRLQRKSAIDKKYFSTGDTTETTVKNLHAIKKHSQTGSLIDRYRRHWPMLLLSILFWIGLLVQIVLIPPAQVANVGFTHSYLPVLITLWLALTGTFSYITLNTWFGISASTAVTVILFLRTLNIFAPPIVSLVLLVVIVGLLFVWKKGLTIIWKK